MNKCPYMVVYFDDIFDKHVKHRINYPTAKEALKRAAFHASCFWVHRVEVWDGDRRMLLAVS